MSPAGQLQGAGKYGHVFRMNLAVRFRLRGSLWDRLAAALQNILCGGFVRGMIANPILARAHRIGRSDKTQPKHDGSIHLQHPVVFIVAPASTLRLFRRFD